MIYEDQGDMEKALQFGLIAAHLNPSDCEEWVKLADMSLEQDNIKQAIICYTKGLYTYSRYTTIQKRSPRLHLKNSKHCENVKCV